MIILLSFIASLIFCMLFMFAFNFMHLSFRSILLKFESSLISDFVRNSYIMCYHSFVNYYIYLNHSGILVSTYDESFEGNFRDTWSFWFHIKFHLKGDPETDFGEVGQMPKIFEGHKHESLSILNFVSNYCGMWYFMRQSLHLFEKCLEYPLIYSSWIVWI